MSTTLVVLSLASFALVSLLVTGLVSLALPLIDQLAEQLGARHRVRLWLSLAAIPSVVAALAVVASFLPALGLGHDHCLAHVDSHPHLCPHHIAEAPSIALLVLAGLFAARVVHALVQFSQAVRLGEHTSAALAQASDREEDLFVYRSAAPAAFVLGALRPRVHVSHGLLALGGDVVEPVIAHERVHARHRDHLWRGLFPALAVGHWPVTAGAIKARLAAAQEMAADEEAAGVSQAGRLRVAQALVLLARFAEAPATRTGVFQAGVEARVCALLEGPRAHSRWPVRLLLVGGLGIPVTLSVYHPFIHHGLEKLLGALT